MHYVVTEFGVADLFGKSLRERAQALIGIAHPDFREELRAAARKRNLLMTQLVDTPWTDRFAIRTEGMTSSAIRELLKLTADPR